LGSRNAAFDKLRRAEGGNTWQRAERNVRGQSAEGETTCFIVSLNLSATFE